MNFSKAVCPHAWKALICDLKTQTKRTFNNNLGIHIEKLFKLLTSGLWALTLGGCLRSKEPPKHCH